MADPEQEHEATGDFEVAAAEPAGGCPSCGAAVGAADSFCESCGTELGPQTMGAPPPSGRDHAELNLGLLAGVTDRGVRHLRNEDAMALAAADGPGGPVAAAVVCDGVSTSPRAGDASLTATQASIRVLLAAARRGDDPAEASLAGVQAAHQALSEIGSPGDAPSATYISALIDGAGVTVCWLGDSRAYWLGADGPGPTRLSTDDSLAEELIARGVLEQAEAMASPQAHVITRWLGADVTEPRPHVARFEPPGPGVVLVCSDGLWNYEPEAAALAALALPVALTDPLAAASVLVKFALDAGGMDNVTAVLAPFPLAPFSAGAVGEAPHPKTLPVPRLET
jgi:serine/threonine protein phosphatase PrpC